MSQHFCFVSLLEFTAEASSASTQKKCKSIVLTIEEGVKVPWPPIFHHFTYLNKFSYLNNDKFSVPKGVRIIEVPLYCQVHLSPQP